MTDIEYLDGLCEAFSSDDEPDKRVEAMTGRIPTICPECGHSVKFWREDKGHMVSVPCQELEELRRKAVITDTRNASVIEDRTHYTYQPVMNVTEYINAVRQSGVRILPGSPSDDNA